MAYIKLIKTKRNSGEVENLKVQNLAYTGLTAIDQIGRMNIFATSSVAGWLPCDGRTISYASDSSPGYIQTAYENLITILKAEAAGDPTHPYYNADSYSAVLPSKFSTAVGMPIGSPFYFTSPTAPDGCLSFGDAEYSQATYPELYAVIGDMFATTGGRSAPAAGNFRVPPLGYFWRTLDSTGTYDTDGSGRTAGDSQEDAMQRITGIYDDYHNSNSSGASGVFYITDINGHGGTGTSTTKKLGFDNALSTSPAAAKT